MSTSKIATGCHFSCSDNPWSRTHSIGRPPIGVFVPFEPDKAGGAKIDYQSIG